MKSFIIDDMLVVNYVPLLCSDVFSSNSIVFQSIQQIITLPIEVSGSLFEDGDYTSVRLSRSRLICYNYWIQRES